MTKALANNRIEGRKKINWKWNQMNANGWRVQCKWISISLPTVVPTFGFFFFCFRSFSRKLIEIIDKQHLTLHICSVSFAGIIWNWELDLGWQNQRENNVYLDNNAQICQVKMKTFVPFSCFSIYTLAHRIETRLHYMFASNLY